MARPIPRLPPVTMIVLPASVPPVRALGNSPGSLFVMSIASVE
jgi:hypothetical protein